MTVVREVADALKMLTDVINNTRDIIDAVNDGRKYLAAKYPDARGDLAKLLDQMEITVVGLADVTKILTGFQFTVEGTARDLEPARYNSYVIEQRAKSTELRGKISSLKGNCEEIRKLRDALNARAEGRQWWSTFTLLGVKDQQRAQELWSKLSDFYADDLRMIDAIELMLTTAERAIDEVSAALGGPGLAYPQLVLEAAAVLKVYDSVFRDSQRDLVKLADSLRTQARELT
jgi:hypothetical protein